jgi:hypothetical protein
MFVYCIAINFAVSWPSTKPTPYLRQDQFVHQFGQIAKLFFTYAARKSSSSDDPVAPISVKRDHPSCVVSAATSCPCACHGACCSIVRGFYKKTKKTTPLPDSSNTRTVELAGAHVMPWPRFVRCGSVAVQSTLSVCAFAGASINAKSASNGNDMEPQQKFEYG